MKRLNAAPDYTAKILLDHRVPEMLLKTDLSEDSNLGRRAGKEEERKRIANYQTPKWQ